MHGARLTLSGNALKAIAVAAMVLDHTAYLYCFSDSPPGVLLHFIGRLTAPIMCFFIAEGYYHTRSLIHYATRLLVFAVLSQLPYSLVMERGTVSFPPLRLNMLFTLLCGLLALHLWNSISNGFVRYGAVLLCALATWQMDWAVFGVLFVFVFGAFHANRRTQFTVYVGCAAARVCLGIFFAQSAQQSLLPVISLFGLFAVPPILMRYNGRRTAAVPMARNRAKWFFYIAYPAHLAALGLIYRYLPL